MAIRYANQVNEQSMPNALARSAVTPASTGVQVGQAIEGLGQQAGRFAAIARQKQEEFDMTRVAEANNALTRELMSYTNAPDTGVFNTRKLGNARGVTEQFENDAKAMIDATATRLDLTPAQTAAFHRVAMRTATPFYSSTQNFEVNQTNAYRAEQAKTTQETSLQMVLESAFNPEAMDVAMMNVDAAVSLEMSGASEETRALAVSRAQSDIERQRLAYIALSEPFVARDMAEASKYLLPTDRARLDATLRPELVRAEVQDTVDAIFAERGADNPQETIDWIRKNYKGTREDAIIAGYNTRVSEATLRRNAGVVSEEKRQKQYWEEVLAPHKMDGTLTEQMLWDAAVNRDITSSKYETELGKLNVKADRVTVENQLRRQLGTEWNTYSADQRESMVMARRGITQGDRESAVEDLRTRILDPESGVTAEDINDAYDTGLITPTERESFKNALRGYGAHQQKVVKYERTKLTEDLGTLFSNRDRKAGPDTQSQIAARQEFNSAVADLDPNDPEYASQVRQARRDAVTSAVESANRKLESTFLGRPTAFGREWQAVQDVMDQQPIQDYAPDIRISNVDLDNVRMPSPVRAVSAVAARNAAYGVDLPLRTGGTHITNMPAGLSYTPSSGPISQVPENRPRMQTLRDTQGEYISELSAKYNVPENLIYGLVEQESGGDADALSSAGAVGYMQLMPATAQSLGVDPADPRQNLDGGVRYLGQKLKEWDGNVEDALSAYHSGSGAVSKARKGGKQLGPVGKNYAPRVLANAAKYTGATVPEATDFGTRADGSAKGGGFFGPLMNNAGQLETEYAIRARVDGVAQLVPTLIPTLTKAEFDHVRSGQKPTPAIRAKAAEFAAARKAAGQPVFATPTEVEAARQNIVSQAQTLRYMGPAAAMLGPQALSRTVNAPRTGEAILRYGTEDEFE